MANTHLRCNIKKDLNKYYRICPRSKNKNLNINDYVKNDQNLYGKITDKNNEYMIVAWNDNTYERIKLASYDNSLIRINEKEYVDTIESQISPLQGSPINTASIHEKIYNKDETYNKNKIRNKDETHNKNETCNKDEIQQLIDLAINKGIIDANDAAVERAKIESLDERALQQYKDEIINYNDDGEVTSLSMENATNIQGLSPKEAEAHNMLNQLKYQRGLSSPRNNIDIYNANSRSIKDIDNYKITFANKDNLNIKQVSLEDSLMNSLSDTNTDMDINNNNDIDINNDINTNSGNESALDSIIEQLNNDNKLHKESKFLNTPFNGITKPLLIKSPDNINPVNVAFKELFSPDMWTVMSKR